MTEALLRRDLILQSVRFAAQPFLSAADWNTAAERVLEQGEIISGPVHPMALEERVHERIRELDELSRNIEHIKKIVAMQPTYAKVSGSHEEVEPAQLTTKRPPSRSGSRSPEA